MKVKEFIEKIQAEDVNLETICEVRTYIPIAEKKIIIETILDKCSTVEDGVLLWDDALEAVVFELSMLKYHTDLEVDITSEDDYDEIKKTGIDVHWGYYSDYNECLLLFKKMKKSLRSQYSVESSIARLSNQISDNIGGLTEVLTEKIKAFDVDKFGIQEKELGQLKSLLNKFIK